jgi:hypothetical protein
MTRSAPRCRAAIRVAAIVALTATSAAATSNLNLSKSNINRIQRGGTLVTGNAEVRGDVPVVVYNTPANADFILTQVCAGPVNGGVYLASSFPGAATQVRLAFVGGGQCHTFSPGLPLPAGQAVTCTPSFDFEAETFCTINGIQTLPLPSATPRP